MGAFNGFRFARKTTSTMTLLLLEKFICAEILRDVCEDDDIKIVIRVIPRDGIFMIIYGEMYLLVNVVAYKQIYRCATFGRQDTFFFFGFESFSL